MADEENKEATEQEKPSVDIDALKKENTELKSKMETVDSRLEKYDKLEKDREERERKKEEADRIKKEGHQRLLEEKDEKLKETSERLAEFEKKQLDAADKKFASLPEEVQEAIKPLRDKLDVADWVDHVERQYEVTSKSETSYIAGDQGGGTFMRPGDRKSKSGYEPSKKAMEIIDEIGKGDEGIKILTSKTAVDEDTNTRVTKFSRPVREFIKGMDPMPVQRLEVKK